MSELAKHDIETGQTSLGVEFGSTRIKAVLIDSKYSPIAQGMFEWENQLENGIWTYPEELIWEGLQTAYAEMAAEVKRTYHTELKTIGSIGFSAMMHGYMPFNAEGKLLVPFRTWRNSITEQASVELTSLFNFNIPQRWSIAHLYQAILNQEQHVKDIDFITTLAGYVHWKVSGEKVLGIGDASGVFPIDMHTKNYDQSMVERFDKLRSVQQYHWQLSDILPKVLAAGETAGVLTAAGARLLDPSGTLQAGARLAAPEGDAGTGMVATNAVRVHTGNVSAGTSAFVMIVMDKPLSKWHSDIDIVTTPTGELVAMVHANNSSSDINAWAKLFKEFADLLGVNISTNELYAKLFNTILGADADADGLLTYGYYSGENITHMSEGRPLLARQPDSNFTIGNLMRANLYSAFGAMKIGLEILADEQVETDSIVAAGGIFKTPVVAQKILAAVMEAPVTVMKTAGEGGPWGMAILAAYANGKSDQALEDFLDREVFVDQESTTIFPDKRDIDGFNVFMDRYKAGLPIEAHAVLTLNN
ncbi:xylulokinase [Weissella soli]|uniref:L-ribulokinase n=1 Tax=Weissella soli TaxID=155866 RepID=A0A288Q900_9LACO|nr:FGGY-family carbohydrate kinase [Weissella soli]AOT56684.1 Ribulokinase [Weissella soli]NKY83137.1 FGGY-family carbohydrate kinase [Weissella soli]RDL12247.1 L-ribulokinase [Weissella soli]GEN92509.1 ATPase [Weissella soli]